MGSGQVLVILANLPCVLILGIVNFIPLLFLGEGNGNPLQCSCLENPRDGGAWGAAVCGVAQSRTRLKRRSSSSGSNVFLAFASLFFFFFSLSLP